MRRCLVTLSLVAALAAAQRRKSLGFGFDHPHAVYKQTGYDNPAAAASSFAAAEDPFQVAHTFIRRLANVDEYKIRSDSYTDRSSGITHVYAKQLINGVEVVDGDINLNIKDGVVISYGNSFYTGPAVQPFEDANHDDVLHQHQDFCQQLDVSSGGQVVFAADHCNGVQDIPYQMPGTDDSADPRSALLQFMLQATPNVQLHADITSNYAAYKDKMSLVYSHSFAPSGSPTELTISNVPDTINPVKARLAYSQVPNKSGNGVHLQLVWHFEVEMRDNWYETAVSAAPPHRIISVVDWASDASPEASASYNVYAWGVNDPSYGNRSIVKENFDALASPVGWHAIPYSVDPSITNSNTAPTPGKDFWRNTTTTWGNNVFAQENWEGLNNFISNYRPNSINKTFDYAYAPRSTNNTDAQDEAYSYINATVAQLFYTTNSVHDLFYRYGFTEEAGNFQQYNFERGGLGGDAVIANAQDGSGYNNANFMTPPDGQNGRMRMYLWNTALPYRDGDFEAGIVIHELAHGLSTRLTGGPANSGCLGWGESGGMGEGWGDFLATSIRSTSKYSDFPMGEWAANRTGGIRNYPYSLNQTINPSTYKHLDKPAYWGVHAIGEVWAQMLWVVNQRLIEKWGFEVGEGGLFPPKPKEDGTVPEEGFYRPRVGKKRLVPKKGNTLMVQLVIDGMKLQPCRPSFFDARDAIIQADQQLTGGENFCDIWQGFASRGLGVDAIVEGKTPWGGGIRTDGFAVPHTCK